MMKQKRIALVIKTSGLEYDDRVRKEIQTIQKLYPSISFKIFVMLPENKETEGVTSYGTPYKSVYVPSRDKYPSAKKAALKSYEFYKTIKDELKEFDAVWCANDDTAVVAALVKTKHLIWDLHELPTAMMSSKLKRWLLKFIFSRCQIVIHANPQRAAYLQGQGLIKQPEKHYALRNYPNFEDKDPETDNNYLQFEEWKKDGKCVYLQGLNNESRAAFETVDAVMQTAGLIAVIVGGFDENSKHALINKYGEELEKRVYFAGKIPQMKIPQFVEKCQLSLIFYKNVRPNNWLCEANRFYQSIILGLPVVTGNNPPMKEIVEKYGFGVSIDDDGGNTEKIKQGIHDVLSSYDVYRKNIEENKHNLLWGCQKSIIKEIVDLLQ